jgi:hypothetical protein
MNTQLNRKTMNANSGGLEEGWGQSCAGRMGHEKRTHDRSWRGGDAKEHGGLVHDISEGRRRLRDAGDVEMLILKLMTL